MTLAALSAAPAALAARAGGRLQRWGFAVKRRWDEGPGIGGAVEGVGVFFIPSAKWHEFPWLARLSGRSVSRSGPAAAQGVRQRGPHDRRRKVGGPAPGAVRTWGPSLRSRRYRKTLKGDGEAGGPCPGWTRAGGPRGAAGSWRWGGRRQRGPTEPLEAPVSPAAGRGEEGGRPCGLGGKGPWKRREPPRWRRLVTWRSRPGLGVEVLVVRTSRTEGHTHTGGSISPRLSVKF